MTPPSPTTNTNPDPPPLTTTTTTPHSPPSPPPPPTETITKTSDETTIKKADDTVKNNSDANINSDTKNNNNSDASITSDTKNNKNPDTNNNLEDNAATAANNDIKSENGAVVPKSEKEGVVVPKSEVGAVVATEKSVQHRDFKDEERIYILGELLAFQKETGVLPRGVISKIADKYKVHRSRIFRLWKSYCSTPVDPHDEFAGVRSKKPKNCGAKNKHGEILQALEEQQMDLADIKSLRELAMKTGFSKTTIHRMIQKGTFPRHLIPSLAHKIPPLTPPPPTPPPPTPPTTTTIRSNDTVGKDGGPDGHSGKNGVTPTVKKTKVYSRDGDQGTSLLGGRRVSKADAVFEAIGTLEELTSVVGLAHANCYATLEAEMELLRDWLSQILSRLYEIGSLVAATARAPAATRKRKRISTTGDKGDEHEDTCSSENDEQIAEGNTENQADNSSNARRQQQPAGFDAEHTNRLEEWIDQMTDDLPTTAAASLLLPTGGTTAAAQLHVARTICRRAERRLVPWINSMQGGDVGGSKQKEDFLHKTFPYLNRLSDFLFTAARWTNYQVGCDEIFYQAATITTTTTTTTDNAEQSDNAVIDVETSATTPKATAVTEKPSTIAAAASAVTEKPSTTTVSDVDVEALAITPKATAGTEKPSTIAASAGTEKPSTTTVTDVDVETSAITTKATAGTEKPSTTAAAVTDKPSTTAVTVVICGCSSRH